MKLIQVLGREFRACKSCSRHSLGIFTFPDTVYTKIQLQTLAFHYVSKPKGREAYRFWCGSLRRRRPRSFLSTSSEVFSKIDLGLQQKINYLREGRENKQILPSLIDFITGRVYIVMLFTKWFHGSADFVFQTRSQSVCTE